MPPLRRPRSSRAAAVRRSLDRYGPARRPPGGGHAALKRRVDRRLASLRRRFDRRRPVGLARQVAGIAGLVALAVGIAWPGDAPDEPSGIVTAAAIESHGIPDVPALGRLGAGLPSRRALSAAREFAAGRLGAVSFAVTAGDGRLIGLDMDRRFISASVVKAMLLVAYLEAIDEGGSPLTAEARRALSKMVRVSGNKEATAIYRGVGDEGLYRVAARAGMRRFTAARSWGDSRITAADQARFFAALDGLLPLTHRGFARRLLSSIVPAQSWGIPEVVGPRWRTFFKGGWRESEAGQLVHQVARLENGTRRLSLAVLTEGSPSMGYGVETVRGVAARILG